MQSVLQRIIDAERELGLERKKHAVWYRGHASQSWDLRPSINRPPFNGKYEIEMFATFAATAFRHTKDSDTWNIACLMQHHGLPTRLLDWSDSLGTALFFATEDNAEPSTIYILNPCGMNEEFHETPHIPITNIGFEYSYSDIIENRDGNWSKPIAVAPAVSNERIATQRGYFTVHGSSRAPLDTIAKKYIRKVSLSGEDSVAIQDLLYALGMDRYRLFP